MTDNPSDTPDSPPDEVADPSPATSTDAVAAAPEVDASEVEAVVEEAPEPNEFEIQAGRIAAALGSDEWTAHHRTVKVSVPADRWRDSIQKVKDLGEFPFFSWLSAVDWAKEVAVGDGVSDPDSLEERLEVMCRVSSLTDDSAVTVATHVPRDGGSLDTVSGVYGGADWHERECHEMFGIDFIGHPHLIKLYLPDAFEGHPLRKDYPLLSREVKPWPGTVDVEGKPSTENVEADALASDGADA